MGQQSLCIYVHVSRDEVSTYFYETKLEIWSGFGQAGSTKGQ